MTVRLLGDIGATNARFALSDPGHRPGVTIVHTCERYQGLEQAVEACLEEVGSIVLPTEAAFAVAAAVTGDIVTMTNHPWRFSVSEIKDKLRLDRLTVINDFTAIALSLPWLEAGDRQQIGCGNAVAGHPLGVLGPGSGLGVSGLIPTKSGWVPLAGEGGHTEFAPQTEREVGIFRALGGPDRHLSLERLLSGRGLTAVHRALTGECLDGAEPITKRALAGERTARETITVFSEILGAAAGNLALTLGARGGIFIAGGIVPKLGHCFDEIAFRRRFERKGRMSSYLTGIPTYLITTEYPALIGLANY